MTSVIQWFTLRRYHSRLPLLNQDLRLLLPTWQALDAPVHSAERHAWGIRYVIEGMTLGAQWMLKKSPIFQNPSVTPATAFFQYHLTAWPDFCRELERACVTDAAKQSAVASACWMFRQFRLRLEEVSREQDYLLHE